MEEWIHFGNGKIEFMKYDGVVFWNLDYDKEDSDQESKESYLQQQKE